jgi:hypothetical protein
VTTGPSATGDRRKTLAIIVAALVVVAVVVGILLAVDSGDAGSSGLAAPSGVAEVQSLLAGIPSRGN